MNEQHPPAPAAPLRSPGLTAATFLAAASLLAGPAGCVDYLGPDVGGILVVPCSNEDSDPAVAIDYQLDIQGPIFDGPCRRCHDPTSERPVGITRVGLDLSSYGATRRGGVNTRKTIVLAEKPCKSMLYLKLLDGPPFGARMPSNGPPYLTEEDTLKLHDWIAEGARE